MKYMVSWVCLILVCGAVSAQGAVFFADENLKTAIQDALFIWWDPTEQDMRWETRFSLTYEGITDLTGIETAINLQYLNLRGNQVTDVSPLEALTQLTELNLSENSLSDLSGVATLTQLRSLDVHGNGVSNLSPLSGMRQLESLTVRDNRFQGNLSALSSLTELEYLDLQENQISNLDALRHMTKLKHLYLYYNGISSVSVLANMPRLETLDLRYNRLNTISQLAGLTQLKKLSLTNNSLYAQAYVDLQIIKDNNPNIDLAYDPRNTAPVAVQATTGTNQDHALVTWDAVANGPSYTSYYRVFRAMSQDAVPQAVSGWQIEPSFSDISAIQGVPYIYWVQTALSNKGLEAGDLSMPVQARQAQSLTSVLSMQTSVGALVSPEPGTHTVETGIVAEISTQSLDPNLFVFTRWSGSAVDNGKVLDPNQALTSVTMDANETLVAMYHTTLEALVVDANAIDDANQQGTEAYPLAHIQDAVALAVDGMAVFVRPGLYEANVDFEGKAIELIGADLTQAELVDYPVILGDGSGPVVSFVNGEPPEATLEGFVITGGTGGIVCIASSPTLVNCIVAGNRTEDPNEAAVVFVDSHTTASNLTIADNLCGTNSAALCMSHSEVFVTNSILWGNMPQSVLTSQDDISQIYFSDIQGGWTPSNPDLHVFGVLNQTPEFVRSGEWIVPEEDPNALVFVPGDYHLQSQAGYWNSVTQTWLSAIPNSP